MPLSFTWGQANTHPAQVNPSKYSFGNLMEYQLRHSSSHLTGTLWKLPLWSVRGAPGNPVFDSGQCNGFSKLISNTELTAAGSVSSIHRWILTGLPFLSIWEQSPVRIQFSLSDFDHNCPNLSTIPFWLSSVQWTKDPFLSKVQGSSFVLERHQKILAVSRS